MKISKSDVETYFKERVREAENDVMEAEEELEIVVDILEHFENTGCFSKDAWEEARHYYKRKEDRK